MANPHLHLPSTLSIQPYKDQMTLWPSTGRHILAQYDPTFVVVYQAYNPAIAAYAVQHQKFGGDSFSFTRMSWIKTNFAWMQYRSGWNTKPGQSRTLAVKITRDGFNTILENATEGKYIPEFGLEEEYLERKTNGGVRLQWDPDYLPVLNPDKLQRRAIQLGLKGEILKKYATEWIVSIEDITDFVIELREILEKGEKGMKSQDQILEQLSTPTERVLEIDARKFKYLNMFSLGFK